MFKKVNAVLVVVALLLGMLCTCFVAGADNTPAFQLVANKIAYAGDTWTVDVKIANIPQDTGVSGMLGELEFDTDVMTLTDSDVIDSTLNDEDLKHVLPYTDPETGVTKFAFVCEPATKNTDAIIRLTFQIDAEAEVGEYDLTISATDVVDGAADPAAIDVEPDTFTVTVLDYMWGDADSDDATTPLDAVQILRYVVKMVTIDQIHVEAADVTGDDAVTLGDAVMILRYLADLYNPYV